MELVDGWTGRTGLQTSSLPGHDHDDLENETVRRRHVTGEGHNGDTLTSTVAVVPTGKKLLLQLSFHHVLTLFCGVLLWRVGVTGKAFGLAISRSQVQILLEAALRNNLRQVVYTYVPLSPSSITWYRPKGGDALRLGR